MLPWKAGTRVPPPTASHAPSPLAYPTPTGSLGPTGSPPPHGPLFGHGPLWEGSFPHPTYCSHRLPEVTPPPTRARPQNHGFAVGPQAPQGTLFPPCDTVAHRATGSQGSQPRPAAPSISTTSTYSPSGGPPRVAHASSLGPLWENVLRERRRPASPPESPSQTTGSPSALGPSCGFTRPTVTPAGSAQLGVPVHTSSSQPSWDRDPSQQSPRPPTVRLGGLASHDRRSALLGHTTTMSYTRAHAIRQGPSSPSPPDSPNREAGPSPRPGTIASPTSLRFSAQVTAPPSSSQPRRKRSITLLDFWPSMRPGKTGRLMPTTRRGDPTARGGRCRPEDPAAPARPSKLLRPSPPGSDFHHDRGPIMTSSTPPHKPAGCSLRGPCRPAGAPSSLTIGRCPSDVAPLLRGGLSGFPAYPPPP